MPRLLLLAPLFCAVAVAAPVPAPEPPAPPAGVAVEAVGVDDSVLKLQLLDDKLELVTKYGPLSVPAADVRKIEFAHRCPPDVQADIAKHLSNLGHADFKIREDSTASLKKFRERAYPFVLKEAKSADPEAARRADEVAKDIRFRVPAARLEVRECDTVHTEDQKFVGKLSIGGLRVRSAIFGEQVVKVADLKSLRSATGVAADLLLAAPDGPATLAAFNNQFGKELAFSVVGYDGVAQPQPTLWGSGPYTLDSNLGAAAVHAGVVPPGQKGVVRVRVVASPPQFVGTAANGVTSQNYGVYPLGSYEFVK